MKKVFYIFGIFLVLLFAGCTQTQYICPDGTTAFHPSQCTKEKPLQRETGQAGMYVKGRTVIQNTADCIKLGDDKLQEECVLTLVNKKKPYEINKRDTYLDEAEEIGSIKNNEIYEKIKTGMTQQQVLRIIGREPIRIQKMEHDIGTIEGIAELEELTGKKMKTKTEYEYWYYGSRSGLIQIGFRDGKVATKANY